MGLTYNSFFNSLFNTVAAASTGLGSSATDPIWSNEVPNVIDYGEQRMYRDLDLLVERVTDTSAVATAFNRLFDLPTSIGTFVVLEYLSVITPSTAAIATGARTPLIPVSRAYLDFAFPANSSYSGTPQVYAMRDNASVLLGPSPNLSFPMECIGTQRPAPLSASNQTTFLSTQLPDVFFACCMIKASAFMRDFGQESDAPAMSTSWEAQYQLLLKSADMEEARKMYRSAGWTAQQQRAASAPPRTQ